MRALTSRGCVDQSRGTMAKNSILSFNEMQIVLCSASPRRKWIFETAGYPVIQIPANIDESLDSHLGVFDSLKKLATEKLAASLLSWKASPQLFPKILPNRQVVFVAADTEVLLNATPLGKAESVDQARVILESLSGKTHDVVTAVAFQKTAADATIQCFYERTQIEFREIAPTELQRYLDSNEWRDKAGAYAIQGLGGSFVRSINGDLLNVIGFPLAQFESQVLL